MIDCIPYNNSNPLTNNDYIIAYYLDDRIGYTRFRPDSSNSIDLYSDVLPYHLSPQNDFKFKIYNSIDTCIIDSENIHVVVDSISELRTWSVKSMNSHIPDVTVRDSIICSNVGLTQIIEPGDLEGYIWFDNDKNMKVSDSGFIVLDQEYIGFIDINIHSEFCLLRNSIRYEIVEPMLFADTLPIVLCEGELLDEKLSTMYNLVLPDTGWDISLTAGDSQFSVFVYETDRNGCSGVQSLNIDYIVPEPVEITEEYFCDKTTLNIANHRKQNQYRWSNGKMNDKIDIYDNTQISVTKTDENGCVNEESIEVQVHRFEIEQIDMNIIENSCFEYGKIEIISNQTKYGSGNYSFYLHNTLDESKSGDDLNKVNEGVYRIRVEDVNRGCTTEYEQDVVVMQDCLNNYPVFTPNADNSEDEYFITYEGYVEIYDRNGRKLRRIETPAYWDGKDERGRDVAMGNYVMVTDQGKVVNVTIIR